MQVPILSGVYSRKGPDFERSYPLNCVPNVEETGISKGYLKLAPGTVTMGQGHGLDAGGIVWNGVHYRVSGEKLVTVAQNGTVSTIGAIPGTGAAAFAYSFDRLAIARGGQLHYLKDSTLSQVTDPDLGQVVDMIWSDGYFVTTDGESIVVTELNDPTKVDPLKYGSSEADPDRIKGLIPLRGEIYVPNRHTIEVFQNVGGNGFPFARARGAMIPKGIVGTKAKCLFVETFAFCGSGRDEGPGVYLAGAGQAVKISNRALDKALAALTDDELAAVALESRHSDGAQELFVHLPRVSFVYSYNASQALDLPVWYRLASGSDGGSAYRPRGYVRAHGSWWCGDAGSAAIGRFDDTITRHFGLPAAFEFDAAMIFGPGGAICHELELIGQYGRGPLGADPVVFMSWTDDGRTFSQERRCRAGAPGQRSQRLAWRRNGAFRQWRSFRFRGVVDTPMAFTRLEARLEELNAGN